jgi:transcriptional regulator with XRE-family HTH domain
LRELVTDESVVEWATKGCVYASFLVEWEFNSRRKSMDKNQAKAFGAMLRQRRQALHLTVRQVGDAAHIPNTTISRIETGSFKAPRPDKLARIAQVLELSPAEVFARVGYLSSGDLPTFPTYLRTSYPDLPDHVIERLHGHLLDALSEFGLSPVSDPLEELANEPSGVSR